MTFTDLLKFFPQCLDEGKIELFHRFYVLVSNANSVTNLTRIEDEDDAVVKHFYDSLYPSTLVEMKGRLADLGSGAGFPGIVFAIAYPHLQVTLVESNGKKASFLHEASKALGLENVRIAAVRAESMKEREYFDIVTARAVADLPIVMELSAPLLKVGGCLIAMKGRSGHEELERSAHAMKSLSLSLTKEDVSSLPEEKGTRTNLYFLKTRKTARKFPRDYADIKRNPL